MYIFSTCSELVELLKPLEEQQRSTLDRLSKVQHTLEVLGHQQRERDSRHNINRDMVVLVVLVVMIQAVLNWVTGCLREAHFFVVRHEFGRTTQFCRAAVFCRATRIGRAAQTARFMKSSREIGPRPTVQ
jgi:hypothetical protein